MLCANALFIFIVCMCVFSLVKTFVTIVLCGVMCGRRHCVHVCVFIGLKVGYYSTTQRCVQMHYAFSLCACVCVFSLVKRLVTIVLHGVMCRCTIVARPVFSVTMCG